MLADAGIIAPVLDPDVVEEAHAHMLHLLRNGEEHDHEDTKSADTKHKSTEVKVASFDC